MEETGCEVICGAPTTLIVKGIGNDDDDDETRDVEDPHGSGRPQSQRFVSLVSFFKL